METDSVIRLLGKVLVGVALLCVLLVGGYAILFAALPARTLPEGQVPVPVLATVEAPSPEAWNVFARPAAVGAQSELAKVFRFAGYMFLRDHAKAILDHLEQREQFIVAEGDRIGAVEVVRIARDHVVLRSGGREEELWLSFQGGGGADSPAAESDARELGWDERVIETSPYGKRIAENRWILSRDALLGYHQAMLDDPERLAALFLSMRPDYNADREIEGYQVDIQGENEFFKAVGLGEGDVVREVNSMSMVSQARAEYFIREFAQGRLTAVVLDVERQGTPQKLIYYIR